MSVSSRLQSVVLNEQMVLSVSSSAKVPVTAPFNSAGRVNMEWMRAHVPTAVPDCAV